MSLYTTFKTDETLEKEGVWLEYGTASNGEPIRIKIARAGGQNTAFIKALEKATKPYRRAIQSGRLDDNTADRLYITAFAEHVVLNWVNVEDPQGKPVEFNRGNVILLLDELPDLFADLREQASNMQLFRAEELEEDLGNSGRSLSTDSSKGRAREKY